MPSTYTAASKYGIPVPGDLTPSLVYTYIHASKTPIILKNKKKSLKIFKMQWSQNSTSRNSTTAEARHSQVGECKVNQFLCAKPMIFLFIRIKTIIKCNFSFSKTMISLLAGSEPLAF